jgi:general secretion pathway protein N
LGDPEGTLWNGSAFVGGSPGGAAPVAPLLPGRFSWRISPLLLLGQVDVELENPETLSQKVNISGGWSHWTLSPASINLPAERLGALGAPLNTIRPSGQMKLSWSELQLARQNSSIDVSGSTILEMNDMSSRLSPIKPLGAYKLAMDWHGQQAQLLLTTIKGPMLLSGAGSLTNGRLQFAGKAEAEAGQEEKLAGLLNLLGQRRREGNKNIIALEFK